MIDKIFDLCVLLLVVSANELGMTYKAINVWIFVIIWPIITLILLAILVWQYLKLRRLTRQVATLQPQINH